MISWILSLNRLKHAQISPYSLHGSSYYDEKTNITSILDVITLLSNYDFQMTWFDNIYCNLHIHLFSFNWWTANCFFILFLNKCLMTCVTKALLYNASLYITRVAQRQMDLGNENPPQFLCLRNVSPVLTSSRRNACCSTSDTWFGLLV